LGANATFLGIMLSPSSGLLVRRCRSGADF
jgi:hypothetical protein